MDEGLRYFHRVQDYKLVFDSEAGQRVLADLEKSYDDTFHVNSHLSSYKQGKRQVVRDIKRLLELAHNPEFTEESVGAYFGDTTESTEEFING